MLLRTENVSSHLHNQVRQVDIVRFIGVIVSFIGKTAEHRRKVALKFVESCQLCKLCALAAKDGSILITPLQLRVLTPKVLVNILLYQHSFFLASKIARMVGVPRDKILLHWALAKAENVSPDISDDQLYTQISTKIKDDALEPVHFPYATVAACAASNGRMKLALHLAQQERNNASKTLLLLKLNEYEKALNQVTVTPDCDPDLFAYTLMHCITAVQCQVWNQDDLFRVCASLPRMRQFLINHLRESDPKLFGLFMKTQQMHNLRAKLYAEAACMTLQDFREKMRLLAASAAEFEKANNTSKCKLSLEQAKLWEMQHSVADSLVGTSLHHTILDCFKRNNEELAEKFKKEFKLKEATYRRLQLNGLAFCKNWPKMEELSRDKNVLKHLSLMDFAQACFDTNDETEGIHYVERLPDSGDKAFTLLRLKHYSEALECAFNIGNVGILMAIKSSCDDSNVIRKVNDRIAVLSEQDSEMSDSTVHSRSRGLSAVVADSLQDKAGCAQQ